MASGSDTTPRLRHTPTTRKIPCVAAWFGSSLEREFVAMAEKQPAVYILASGRNGTLYIGVTSSLLQRIYQHKNDFVEGFSRKYRVHSLVYYELHTTMAAAITREKQLKKWNRAWKLRLIESENPRWIDLWPHLLG